MRLGRQFVGRLAVVAGVLAAAAPARAGNDDSFFQGNDAAMSGGAVVADVSDPSAVWYNPAGLGGSDRSRLELSGTAFTYQRREIPDGMFTILEDGRRLSSDLDGSRFAIVAPALGFTRQLSSEVTVGFGVFISQEEGIELGGGIEDVDAAGVATFQRTDLAATAVRYHAGPAIGWQPHTRVRVGAALFGVYETLDAHARILLGTSDPTTMPATQATLLVDVADRPTRVGVEAVVGVQVEPVDGVSVGAVVHGPRLLLLEMPDARALVTAASVEPGVEPIVLFDVNSAGPAHRPETRFMITTRKTTRGLILLREVGRRWPSPELGRLSPCRARFRRC